ncbi:MAG: shikimate dehydrogenase [Alphaproteobacteria bacterium]
MNNFPMAGVMGWPVKHSRSPYLHNHWLKSYHIQGAYGYFPVQAGDLPAAINGLRSLRLAGANVTIPHKEMVCQLVDRLDDTAKAIGAANTLVVHDNGEIIGYNSDVFGFVENLKSGINSHHLLRRAMVLGAGGAARAVIYGLQSLGVEKIYLANRTIAKAEELAMMFGSIVEPVRLPLDSVLLEDCDLLVNSTALGMSGQPPLDIDLAALPRHAAVNDLVYNPLKTPLLLQAENNGLLAIDGLGMLLHQGRLGFKAWFGVDPEVTPALHALIAQTL